MQMLSSYTWRYYSGHITQGKGIVVHRSSCKSIRHIKRDKDNIELRWSENVDNLFSASIMNRGRKCSW